jgi:hypothetical protein
MNDKDQTGTPSMVSNTVWLAVWTVAWVASLALVQFGSKFWWDGNPVLSWIALGLNVAIGIGWIVAHARYLRRSEDLQRKVLLEALAIALGVGVVGGLAYAAANNIGLIDLDFGLAIFPVLAGLTYVVATAVGNLRYR